jgi:hypothetical protein
MNTEEKYFNFPIPLLRPAHSNIKTVCQEIMDYAIYKRSRTLTGSPANRIKNLEKYFGITLGNASRSLENGKLLFDSIPDKTAMTGISKELLFDYYKNDKTDFEISLLLSFLAIKSILGKKSYCRITTDYLICRMAGYTSKIEMEEVPESLKKYLTRRKMDSLKMELKKSFGLKIYARFTRGWFVSFELTEEQLIREVEMKRKKYIEKTQRDSQSMAVKRVLQELYYMNTICTPIRSE